MRWSGLLLKTLKEEPAGASLKSHALLLRGGYIHSAGQGLFTYNTLFLRSIRKLENIIREEMEKQGAREILMPLVQPKSLWEETGRWDHFEGQLQKLSNRSGQEFCLGPTHEEAVVDFARPRLASRRDMPLILYQIQTKYRDEIRPRFGLMRAREFIMKDAYSFDRTPEESAASWQKMFQAYTAVFRRLGARFVSVQADTGAIGGNRSEEFHLLADRGEDTLLVSESGDFAANREICPRRAPKAEAAKAEEEEKPLEEFPTPGIKSIAELADFLKCGPKDLVKILFFSWPAAGGKARAAPKKESGARPGSGQTGQEAQGKALEAEHLTAFLCCGDDEINPVKIKRHFSLLDLPALASPETVRQITGAWPGSCGPCGLSPLKAGGPETGGGAPPSLPIYADHRLKGRKNLLAGANKDGFHIRNANPGRDFEVREYGDFCYAKEGDPSPDGKGVLKERRGIEAGHLFSLSTTYSRKMNLAYLDHQGKKQLVEMGCYGLGAGRTLQALVEQNHDDEGIIWPLAIAPFAVHITLIDPESRPLLKMLDQTASDLKALSLDFFIDDRIARPGVKFKDADLLGLPFRLNLGDRDRKNGELELIVRKTKRREKIKADQLKSRLAGLLEKPPA